MDSDISDKKSDGPGTWRTAEAHMSVETGPSLDEIIGAVQGIR